MAEGVMPQACDRSTSLIFYQVDTSRVHLGISHLPFSFISLLLHPFLNSPLLSARCSRCTLTFGERGTPQLPGIQLSRRLYQEWAVSGLIKQLETFGILGCGG